jgi:hypothetical protein
LIYSFFSNRDYLIKPALLLQVSKRASKLVFVASLVSAAMPLGLKATRRLQGLLMKNPKVVDEVKAAIALVEQRAIAMRDVTGAANGGNGEPGPSGGEGGLVSAGSDDIVHVSAADAQSPTRNASGLLVLESGSVGGQGVAEVAHGGDAEQHTQGSDSVAELQPERSSSNAAVAVASPAAPVRRGWSFTSSS